MTKLKYLILGGILFQSNAFAILDLTFETGYLPGKMITTVNSGSSTNTNFSGYLLKPSIHGNLSFGSLHMGLGPTITFPFMKYDSLPSTVIKNEISVIRYGGEVFVRWELFNFFQPFVRFELGKDSITETTSSYPVITSGPSAGTVLTSQVAEVKFSYGELFYAVGAGFQAKLVQQFSTFLFVGYTAGKSSSVTLESATLNGAPLNGAKSNIASISYSAIQVNIGVMFSI